MNMEPDAIQEIHRQLAIVQEECSRLRQENESLRKLLNLPVPENKADVSQLLKTVLLFSPEQLPSIESKSPVPEKIALFRILFRGREDVYPVLWKSEKTGKKGYSPAVKGGWNNPKDKEKEYLRLTDDVIKDHLLGEQTIGVYPILKDDTCWFLACDFDGNEWTTDALSYCATSEEYGVPAYLERSRSGNGGHVWILFSKPVPAMPARRLGASFLRETMAKRRGLDLASYDRFFPNQDYLPKGGFGNLIALPLQKKCRSLGNTEFLDPATHQPWTDQWVFLSQVKRLSPEQLEGLLEKALPVTAGPNSEELQKKTPLFSQSTTQRISCALSAVLSIETAGIPSSLLSEIKHFASLHNPIFYERQKFRLSTFRTPRFIKCYDQDSSHIHFPRGLTEKIIATINAAGGEVEIHDLRPKHEKIKIAFQGTLSPVQDEAVKAVLAHDQGVLVAPPGSGKTVMGCAITAARSLPALILVHRKPLMDQWKIQLMNLLGIPSNEVGQIGGGKSKQTGVVDLAMIQSLKKKENVEAFFSSYGLVIVDECHHLPAFSFESSIKQAPVRYLLGLTATPYRRDGLQDIIMMQCGPIRHTISRQSGASDNLKLELLARETDFKFEGEETSPIQDIFRAMVNDSERNRMIVREILVALEEGRRCLVLSQWKDHCKVLEEHLSAHGKKPLVLNGGLRKKAREKIFDAIRSVSPNEEFLIIATGQYLGEGFDCPQLDTMFLTFPIAFKGKLIQYTGRLMRPFDSKQNVKVYDYLDGNVPVLKKMYGKRLKTYKVLGFEEEET
jgi:superfamily II DNA or RNA helicase